MGKFQQTVGQRTFAVIYMRNNAKIPDVVHNRRRR
jgi:hypothetical protein